MVLSTLLSFNDYTFLIIIISIIIAMYWFNLLQILCTAHTS